MARRNPGAATQPNAPIDLTSLLDVIFIFLFVVMISNAQRVQKNEAEAEAEIAAAQARVESLEADNQSLSSSLAEYEALSYDYDHLAEAYDASLTDYAALDAMVRKITIYCTYDERDLMHRTIRVLTPDKAYDPIEVYPENENRCFAELDSILTECAVSADLRPAASGAKGSGTSVSSAQADEGASFLVYMLHMGRIERGDRLRIDEIVERLMGEYEDVYYRKVRE